MATQGNPAILQESPIVRALTRFFRWWGMELSACLPENLRAWWSGENMSVLFRIEAGHAVFLAGPQGAGKGGFESILRINLDHPEFDNAEISRRLLRHAGNDFRLFLSVPEHQTLRRTLTLPLAAEENLRQTLSFELDRLTPFKADQAHFDYRIIGRDAAKSQIGIDLAVAKRPDVNRYLQQASDLGLRVHGLAFGDEVLSGDPIGLEASQNGKVSRRAVWRGGAIILAVVLLALLLAIPPWQKRGAAIALIPALDQAKTAAHETDSMRQQLDKLSQEHNALIDKKWVSQSLLVILDELSKRLGDDTYISSLEFDGKTVTINGESASAASLVELLEASPVFKNVAFKSQLSKVQGSAFDRFHLGCELQPEGLPKPPADETIPASAATTVPASATDTASPGASSPAPALAKDAESKPTSPPAINSNQVSGATSNSGPAASAGPATSLGPAPAPKAGASKP